MTNYFWWNHSQKSSALIPNVPTLGVWLGFRKEFGKNTGKKEQKGKGRKNITERIEGEERKTEGEFGELREGNGIQTHT